VVIRWRVPIFSISVTQISTTPRPRSLHLESIDEQVSIHTSNTGHLTTPPTPLKLLRVTRKVVRRIRCQIKRATRRIIDRMSYNQQGQQGTGQYQYQQYQYQQYSSSASSAGTYSSSQSAQQQQSRRHPRNNQDPTTVVITYGGQTNDPNNSAAGLQGGYNQ